MSAKTAKKNELSWIESEVLVSAFDRSGLAGEQFRKLALRLEALNETLKGELNVITVTSPLMGEGKTATAANLALALAGSEGKRVVLIDCDLRNPTLWSLFESAPRTGFLDLLLDKTDVSSVLYRTTGIPLDILALPRASERRMELLPVERVRKVFNRLKEDYDFIICDSPPVLPVADTAALTRLSDGIVLVVRAGQTPRQAVSRVLESVEKEKVVGFVLNAVTGGAVDPYYYPYHGEGTGGTGSKNGKKA
jgi:capsular exopolysaccharide synthesis family protein